MSPVASSVLKQLLPTLDEEVAAQAPSSVAISKEPGDRTSDKKMNAPLQTVFFLAVMSAFIVFSYSTVLGGTSNDRSRSSPQARQLASLSAEEIEAHATWLANDFRESYTFAESAEGEADQQRRLQLDTRMTETLKNTWPECVKLQLTGVQCKKHINKELMTLFTGQDRLVEKISTRQLETEAIAEQHSGITITITTEADTASPDVDVTDPASDRVLEDVIPQELGPNTDPKEPAYFNGIIPQEATPNADPNEPAYWNGIIPQEVDGEDDRRALKRKVRNQVARAHQRNKANARRRRNARRMAVGGQETAGSE